MNIGIISFTYNGSILLQKVIAGLEETFYPYDKSMGSVKVWLQDKFYSCNAIIFIGAVGIATRLIADLILSKDKDPAIIVIDEKGMFVIPILSGHIGGGNHLSHRLANMLGATPVITTATDINGKFAVDVWSVTNGCVIDDVSKVKTISSAVLKGDKVGFYSNFTIMGKLPEELVLSDNGSLGICVSLNDKLKPFDTTLNIIPRVITIGIGCRKNTKFDDLEQFIIEVLIEHNISLKSIKAIASIDLKKEEKCLLEVAKKYGLDFQTFSEKELNAVKGTFNASEFVKATTGVDNVCERSAVLQSGGKLIVNKTVKKGMTLAISLSGWKNNFEYDNG